LKLSLRIFSGLVLFITSNVFAHGAAGLFLLYYLAPIALSAVVGVIIFAVSFDRKKFNPLSVFGIVLTLPLVYFLVMTPIKERKAEEDKVINSKSQLLTIYNGETYLPANQELPLLGTDLSLKITCSGTAKVELISVKPIPSMINIVVTEKKSRIDGASNFKTGQLDDGRFLHVFSLGTRCSELIDKTIYVNSIPVAIQKQIQVTKS
jgi:hypothetical protein